MEFLPLIIIVTVILLVLSFSNAIICIVFLENYFGALPKYVAYYALLRVVIVLDLLVITLGWVDTFVLNLPNSQDVHNISDFIRCFFIFFHSGYLLMLAYARCIIVGEPDRDTKKVWKSNKKFVCIVLVTISIILTALLKYYSKLVAFELGSAMWLFNGDASMWKQFFLILVSGIYTIVTIALFHKAIYSFYKISEPDGNKNEFNEKMLKIFLFDVVLQVLIFLCEIGTLSKINVLEVDGKNISFMRVFEFMFLIRSVLLMCIDDRMREKFWKNVVRKRKNTVHVMPANGIFP